MNNYMELLKARRSNYALGKNVEVQDEDIVNLVETAVLNTPSAFNSQSSKVLVLFNEEHDRLWETVKEALRKIVAPEGFEATSQKIDSFKNAYGTVLYFNDDEVIANMEQQFPDYAANFDTWSKQASGMLQFAVWTGFKSEEIGASLQHYNELIEDQVHAMFNVDSKFKLLAQMPFGSVEQEPGEKQINAQGRVEILGR